MTKIHENSQIFTSGCVENTSEDSQSEDDGFVTREEHVNSGMVQFEVGRPARLSDYEQYRITDNTDIPYPTPTLKINGDRISTPNALTTISGQPKSGKSALTGILIAGAISLDGDIDGLPGVEVLVNIERKAVIHFDTEQDRWTHQYNHKTILKRCKLDHCPDFLLSYNIRQLEINQYQGIVNAICNAAVAQFNGIHSIWIDGGADFIYDTNNPEQSNTIVKYFEGLSQEYRTSIFIVVHTNPGSDKERGHFGSQCQRKSTGILSVKKEGDISYLDPKLLRHSGEVPKVQFKYDKEKGYHVQCNKIEDVECKKAEARLEKAKAVCESVFGGQRSYQYGDAVDAIMKETKTKETTAKAMFKDMKAHEMIVQGTDKYWRINSTGMVV
jgi:hypothetical protein